MWRVIVLAILQSALLCGGQVLLKVALTRMQPFGWTRTFWLTLLSNWPFALCGLSFAAASLLWMYMLKHWPLSVAYPLLSLSYVMGMVAAIVCFHEQVGMLKWIGAACIVVGCILIAK